MSTKSSNHVLQTLNPHLKPVDDDILYHFGLSKHGFDLKSLFGDVKFVCTGGSVGRMQVVAKEIAKSFDICDGSDLNNLSNSDRYCMFKVGPVLCVNHGMGVPSLSIMLVEIIKLLHHAECTDVTFFRIGTSGGIGLEPGTVVVSNGALNGEMEPYHIQYILGECIKRPATLDQDLINDLLAVGKSMSFPVDTGKTMCADDFYEVQGRLDGAFCEYNSEDKFKFLQKLYDKGVRNIEMEAVCFASMLNRAHIKGAILCVTILNRLEGDQVNTEKTALKEFERRPIALAIAYIKSRIAASKQNT